MSQGGKTKLLPKGHHLYHTDKNINEKKSSYLSCENYILKKQVGIDLENCVYLWKFLAKSLGGLKEDK